MISKYFLLAFICFSLGQVQGGELENTIKKGLIKVEALYNRAAQRIDSADRNQSQLIETKAADFIEKIQRMRESSKQILRRVAQISEEKAKEMQKDDSVFECISNAENNANKQIQTFIIKFKDDMESLQKIYLSGVETAAKSLETYKRDLPTRTEKTIAQINACENTRCVENAVKNYSVFIENVLEAVKKIETQISTVVNSFQREAGTSFNNVNRQISRVQSDGLRQIKECVFRRDVFDEEQ